MPITMGRESAGTPVARLRSSGHKWIHEGLVGRATGQAHCWVVGGSGMPSAGSKPRHGAVGGILPKGVPRGRSARATQRGGAAIRVAGNLLLNYHSRWFVTCDMPGYRYMLPDAPSCRPHLATCM